MTETDVADETEEMAQSLLSHWQAAYLLALRITGDATISEDLVQDAFMKALTEGLRHPPRETRPWFLRITANHAKTWLRNSRTRTVLNERVNELKPQVFDERSKLDLADALQVHLNRLEEKYRVPISLHYEQGLSHDEVATVVQVPLGTAKTRITRGLNRLRESLLRDGLDATPVVITLALQDSMKSLAPRPELLTALQAAKLKAGTAAAKTVALGTFGKVALTTALILTGGAAAFTFHNHVPSRNQSISPQQSAPTEVSALVRLAAVRSHIMVLQAEHLGSREHAIDALAHAPADLLILDTHYDTQEADGEYTRAELDRIRNGANLKSHRLLFASVSIGAAENYRGYWKAAWNDAAKRPDWIGAPEADYPDNYAVKYWRHEWLEKLMGSGNAAIDRAIAQGFDGVLLTGIEDYQMYENGDARSVNPETKQTYRRDMVDLVKALETYGRSRKAEFAIIAENGTDLLEFADYSNAIAAQLVSELYTPTDEAPGAKRAELTPALNVLRQKHKPILVNEFCSNFAQQKSAREQASQSGFSLFIARREFDSLGVTFPPP